jgi:hypothetical protein
MDLFLKSALQKGAKRLPAHPGPFVRSNPGASKIAYPLGPDGAEIEIGNSEAQR